MKVVEQQRNLVPLWKRRKQEIQWDRRQSIEAFESEEASRLH